MIAWFARNSVAANILMLLILFAGFSALRSGDVAVEFFPELDVKVVTVSMSLRGATPAEVEEQIIMRIEEAIYDLDGIESLRSIANEGGGRVDVEVADGFSMRVLADDIKSRVDAISTFPEDAENLLVTTPQGDNTAVSVILSGNLHERELHSLSEKIRDEMALLEGISQVEISGVREYEIAVEISENTLQEYGMTIEQVAQAIGQGSVDLSAGTIKSSSGEILLRTKGQAYVMEDFQKIVLRTRPDGSRLTVGDIATVIDGFEEEPFIARFNGAPAATVNVFFSPGQNLLKIADIVKGFVEQRADSLPPGAELTLWRDRAVTVRGRLNTLVTSATFGGILVFVLLTMFLRPQLAFWVCVGIPVAFMGGVALMPFTGVTINIISLFAFILVLGIVVDDAIVTGENIYRHLREGRAPGEECVIMATEEVAGPVTFGVLTTVAAFIPLFFLEGQRGDIFFGIPAIVIPVLLFSLIESKLVLPSHLKHMKVGREASTLGFFSRLQQGVARSLERFVERVYAPVLDWVIRYRYLTLALFLMPIIIIVGLAKSNRMKFVFFDRIGSETTTCNLEMPIGTPFESTEPYIDRIRDVAKELQTKYIDPNTGESVIKYILVTKGGEGLSRGESSGGKPHRGEVALRLIPPEDRTIDVSTDEIVRAWRAGIGVIPGAEVLSFKAHIGRQGAAIELEIKGDNFEQIGVGVAALKERMATYVGVFDIRDDSQNGKAEIQLKLTPRGELLGITMNDLARQTRGAFFGIEAQRVQRGRDDVRVMVRYPLDERKSEENLETMRVRTPAGVEVPLSEVANLEMGTSYSSITREDRKRTVSVEAELDEEVADILVIIDELKYFMDDFVAKNPGLSYAFDGELKDDQKASSSLRRGIWFTAIAIFSLLAIPFKSYLQPLIVMSVIPFGLVGAFIGHMIMGLTLSMMSLFGMLALAGVIVNDSLVLVDYINKKIKGGMPMQEALRNAGRARFRPIILTSLTTFFGLMPLIFERSTQAQFLIPMAVSLGFGILFATFVTLLLVPITYLFLEDSVRALRSYWDWQRPKRRTT
jgi:multidrug efflux pump subunit AcrB